LVVNVSRGIAAAALDGASNGAANGGPNRASGDLSQRVAEAARSWSAKLPVLP